MNVRRRCCMKYGVTGRILGVVQQPVARHARRRRNADNYGDSYTTMDVKMSIAGESASAFVELRNLNDEARRRCRIAGVRTSYEIYSWNLFAGIDWRF